MITNLIKKTAETFNKSTVSKATSQPEPTPEPTPTVEPAPLPQDAPATEPEAILKPSGPKTDKELALESAKQAGYSAGDEVGAEIVRQQKGLHPHLLMVMVPAWAVPVRCWVKDARSWLPVNPPFNRLKARFTGMATNEGELIFESSDICKADRLRRSR
jgi:hypothetical protein